MYNNLQIIAGHVYGVDQKGTRVELTVSEAENLYKNGVQLNFYYACDRQVCPFSHNCLMCPDLTNQIEDLKIKMKEGC